MPIGLARGAFAPRCPDSTPLRPSSSSMRRTRAASELRSRNDAHRLIEAHDPRQRGGGAGAGEGTRAVPRSGPRAGGSGEARAADLDPECTGDRCAHPRAREHARPAGHRASHRQRPGTRVRRIARGTRHAAGGLPADQHRAFRARAQPLRALYFPDPPLPGSGRAPYAQGADWRHQWCGGAP